MSLASHSTSGGPTLYLTGERTLPGIAEENYWFERHVAGYRFAATRMRTARRVLDLGCGEGYGTQLLAEAGADVTGADVYGPAVEHARVAYPESSFARADACALPYAGSAFDALVSLQVIEHVLDPVGFVRECRRVLAPRGTFVCATPNRLTFTPPGRPKNPFHIVEFAPEDLERLLSDEFGSVELVGLVDDLPGLADALIDAAFAETDPPAWTHAIISRVRTDDFRITDELDSSLDLVAICRI